MLLWRQRCCSCTIKNYYSETKKLIEVFQVRRHDERSSSPEHSGIPAIPVVITARRPPTEQVQPYLHLLIIKAHASKWLPIPKLKSYAPGLHKWWEHTAAQEERKESGSSQLGLKYIFKQHLCLTKFYFYSSSWNTIKELGHVNSVNNKLGSLSARHLSTVCKISLRITKERRTIRLASRRCILPSMWEGNRRKPTKRPAAPTQEKMVAKFWTQDIASFLDSFRTLSFSPET